MNDLKSKVLPAKNFQSTDVASQDFENSPLKTCTEFDSSCSADSSSAGQIDFDDTSDVLYTVSPLRR